MKTCDAPFQLEQGLSTCPLGHGIASSVQTTPQGISIHSSLQSDAWPDIEASVLAATPDAVLLIGEDSRIVLANPAVKTVTGYDPDALLGLSLNVLLPTSVRHKHADWVRGFFHHPQPRAMSQTRTIWLHRADGSTIPVDIALGHCQSQGQRYAIAYVRDISTSWQLQERMRYQANHDVLTGLLNRAAWGEQLERMLSLAVRHQRPLAVLLIDLDDFKGVNDSLGHPAGDVLLCTIANRLGAALRAGDVLARLGGDEFAVLLPDIGDVATAQAVAQKLLDVVHQPCQLEHATVTPAASIGVAVAPQDSPQGDALLRYADLALYAAKEAGRNTQALFHPRMVERLEQRIQLHDRLEQALRRGLLELHYQPQIQVDSGRICGVEALLRWTDSELGPISPARFIPVAESTGLIQELSNWVLHTACRQARAWHDQGVQLQVAINLSAQQFRRDDVVQLVLQALREHRLPATWLELEITESEAMSDPQRVVEVLSELASLGVQLSLDDFGTGHSSLACLKQLPVHRLKIDRSFMAEVPQQRADRALYQGLLGLAGSLGLEVVAEGVEKREQLEFLTKHRCPVYQGWLYAPAMPAHELEQRWRQQGAARPR